MPTYEYLCEACDHAFELFHSMKDEPVKKCPKCKKLKVRRLLGTGGGIIFKGTGFYQTDYKSSGKKSDEPSAAKPESKPDSGSKPETPKKKK
jgi:putative FmdB family regulatory protein